MSEIERWREYDPEVQCLIHKGSPIIPIFSIINPIPHIEAYFFLRFMGKLNFEITKKCTRSVSLGFPNFASIKKFYRKTSAEEIQCTNSYFQCVVRNQKMVIQMVQQFTNRPAPLSMCSVRRKSFGEDILTWFIEWDDGET